MQNILEIPEIRDSIWTVSVQDYHKLIELEIVPIKTELIEGVIIKKMTKGEEHLYYSDVFYEFLREAKPSGTIIRKEAPIILKNSEPEPDISILNGTLKDYRYQKPTTAILVVEISKTSLSYDKSKLALYAEAGVENYWIVDIKNKLVEIYTQAVDKEYLHKEIKRVHDSINIFGSKLLLSEVFD